MDNQKIKDINAQVETLLENIRRQGEEIKKYQSGYVAFEGARKALEELATAQGELATALKEGMEDLGKVDAVAVLKRLGEMEKREAKTEKTLKELCVAVKELDERVGKINTTLEEGVKVKKKRLFE